MKKMSRLSEIENIFDSEEFLHSVVESMCGRRSMVSDEGNQRLCSDWGDFIRMATGRTMDESQIRSELSVADPALSDSTIDIVIKVMASRRREIHRHLQTQAVHSGTEGHLADFDWSVRVVLSSEKIANIRLPIFLLNLKLHQTGGEYKDVRIQLTKEQLDDFISECSNIHKTLKQLQV
eukprot:205358_1